MGSHPSGPRPERREGHHDHGIFQPVQITSIIAMRQCDDAEVALAPGRAFGPGGEGYVRITLVENVHRLRQAVRQMDRALNRGAEKPAAAT